MGEVPLALFDFDPYNYVPPPLPLLDPAQLADLSSTPNSRLNRSPHRSKPSVLTKPKGRRNRTCERDIEKAQDTFTLSLVPLEVDKVFFTENSAKSNQSDLSTEPCTCQNLTAEYLHTKSTFPSSFTAIPVIYRDYTDTLFDLGKAYSKYPCVYHRPRTAHFSQFAEQLLDPSLAIYGGSGEEAGRCLRHQRMQQQRAKRCAQALSCSEFLFDSYFESGNLDRVVMVGENDFHLFLTPDTNTQGYTQWFYFSVHNQHRGKSISLSIVNFTKNGSPFGRGMKPSVLSLARARLYGTSWGRGGYDVRYLKNTLPRGSKGLGTYYSLAFSYTFTYDNDTVYFAYAEPYTFTRLSKFLGELREAVGREVRVEEKVIAQTVAGISCVYLTVGDYSPGPKKKVGITARVHPGETVGSFMMEGFLRFLVSSHPAACFLRRTCDFYVIPMLNPDGVIAGNTRTGLVGVDLNRKWDLPDATLHPVISAAKELLSGSICFIDLHGHSKKDFCFMYGNSFSRQDERFWATRFLPICMAKLTSHFSYPFCFFFNSRSHDKAARTVMFNEKKVLHSFTLEASFNGSVAGDEKKEFDSTVLREIGSRLGESIYGLMAFLLKKSGRDVSTQDGVYNLANQLVSRLKQTKNKPWVKGPAATVSTVQTEPQEEVDTEVHEATTETKESQELEDTGSDSDPEGNNLPPAEFTSLEQAITKAIISHPKSSLLDTSGQRRLLKTSSKLLYKDPVERIQLHFLGPSQTQSPLQRRKLQEEESSPVERESRGSLVPMRRYAQVLTAIRKKSHSPGDTMRTPKDVGLEGYLQLVREVRRKLVSRVPAL